MKIPWDLIAEKLDPKASEGAIIQHLAKLRTHLQADGHNVPPPLRRGGHGSSARASANNTPRSGKTDRGEHGTPNKGALTIGVNPRMSSPRMKAEEEEDDDDDDADDEIASATKSELGGVIKIEDDDYDPRRPKRKLRRVVTRGTKKHPPRVYYEFPSEDELESKPVTTKESVIDSAARITKPSKMVTLRVRPGYTSKRFPLGLATWSQGSSEDDGDGSAGKAASGGRNQVGEPGDPWGPSSIPSSSNGLTSNVLEAARLGSTWAGPAFDEYVNQVVLEQVANAAQRGLGSTFDSRTGGLGGQIANPTQRIFDNTFDGQTGDLEGQIANPNSGLFEIFGGQTGDLAGQMANPAERIVGDASNGQTESLEGRVADPARGIPFDAFNGQTIGVTGGNAADELERMLDELPEWMFNPELNAGYPDYDGLLMSGNYQNNDTADAM